PRQLSPSTLTAGAENRVRSQLRAGRGKRRRSAPDLKAAPGPDLESELRAELNVARVVPLRGHEPEGRVARIERQPGPEVRVVEGVQEFAADLQPPPLAEVEVLREREVEVQIRLITQIAERRRDVANAERGQPDESGDINGRDVYAVLPALVVILPDPAPELSHVARVVQIARKHERFPFLPFVSAVELPPADDGVKDTIQVMTKPPAAAHRQQVDAGERVSVRAVVGRDAVFQLSIRRVQVAHLFAQPRVSVRPGESEFLREPLLRLELQRVVPVRAVILLHPDVGELREGQERLRAGDG